MFSRLPKTLPLLLSLQISLAAAAPQPLAAVPEMQTAAPAPGLRVRQTEPEFAGTQIHHSLYLPADCGPSKKNGLIVEYTGNYFPPSGSTGEVSGANLGYAATLGKNFVWIALPYISADGKHNEKTWWGDEAATVRYAKLCVTRAIEKYNIDKNRVILCGFSRGAVAVNYFGLHNDEIAKLWTAFWTHDHFDGVSEWKKTSWGTPLDKYQQAAVARLRRLNGRPYLVTQHTSTEAVENFLKKFQMLNAARFTFLPIPIREIFPSFPYQSIKSPHTDLWPLYPSSSADRLRNWLNEM